MPTPLFNPRLSTDRADRKACRELLRSGSRSFYAASLLLPQPYREAAISLYAFCRLADDAIDLSDAPELALEQLGVRLDRIYRNNPVAHAADRMMVPVVRRFGIPRALLDALLEGFEWDCRGRHYQDASDLRAYCARVAGNVGVMMALLMGQRDRQVLARAADLGVAMQLTNIARDVAEDARSGRLYLPREWMVDAGIDPEDWLAQPTHSDALAAVVKRLLAEADSLYQRAEAGIASLPSGCQPCVMTARLLYGEIGEEVKRRGYNPMTGRAVVSPARKCRVMSGLGRLGRLDMQPLSDPPLAETVFLVDAVRDAPLPALGDFEPVGRVEWMLDLFAELQRRDRIQRDRGFSANPDCPLLPTAREESAAS
jgi:phytoene synthase